MQRISFPCVATHVTTPSFRMCGNYTHKSNLIHSIGTISPNKVFQKKKKEVFIKCLAQSLYSVTSKSRSEAKRKIAELEEEMQKLRKDIFCKTYPDREDIHSGIVWGGYVKNLHASDENNLLVQINYFRKKNTLTFEGEIHYGNTAVARSS